MDNEEIQFANKIRFWHLLVERGSRAPSNGKFHTAYFSRVHFRKWIKAGCLILPLFLALSSILSAQLPDENEVARLMAEKSEIVQKLSGQQSELVRVALTTELESINRRLKLLQPEDTPAPTKNTAQEEAPAGNSYQLSSSEKLPPLPVPVVNAEDRSVQRIAAPTLDPFSYEVPETNVRRQRSTERNYRIDLSVSSRYNSNYSEAIDGAPKDKVFVETSAAIFSLDWLRRERSKLTSVFRFQRDFLVGVNGREANQVQAITGYDRGNSRMDFTFFYLPKRLAFTTSDKKDVFTNLKQIRVGYQRELPHNIRIQGSYEFEQEGYTVIEEQDASKHKVSGDLRFRVHHLFRPGIGFEAGQVRARTDNYSYDRRAPLFMVDSRVGDRLNIAMRYRYQGRDYITLAPASSNFRRLDRRHELLVYSDLRLSNRWWLGVYGSYLNNDSSRADRSFTGHEIGLSLSFRVVGADAR